MFPVGKLMLGCLGGGMEMLVEMEVRLEVLLDEVLRGKIRLEVMVGDGLGLHEMYGGLGSWEESEAVVQG